MKLYGHPLSSCTRKVLLTAAEKDARIDLVPVDLFTGEHKQPAHLARHPFGVVPVLDDAGFVVYESRAIVRYLDARLAGAPLVPAELRDRARMDQWLSVDQSYVAPHVRTLAVQRLLRPREGLAPEPVVVGEAERALARAFAVLDRALGDAQFLAGAAFSLADISLMPYVAGLTMVDAAHLIGDLRHLGRWWSEVSSRASWRRAIAA
jgi:glutathione S-transferase